MYRKNEKFNLVSSDLMKTGMVAPTIRFHLYVYYLTWLVNTQNTLKPLSNFQVYSEYFGNFQKLYCVILLCGKAVIFFAKFLASLTEMDKISPSITETAYSVYIYIYISCTIWSFETSILKTGTAK